MNLNCKEEYHAFINQIDELINTVENRQNQTFTVFCDIFGQLDNFIKFKQAYFNFLKTTFKIILSKLNDEQLLINIWSKKGFVHESLLREHQQRRLLKAILKKVKTITKDSLRSK